MAYCFKLECANFALPMKSVCEEHARRMRVRLDDYYVIQAEQSTYDFAISVSFNGAIIGKAQLTTDSVDVSCVTELSMDEKHASHKLWEQYTVGEAFIKFLIKFPSMVRKPEFRFILETPECLTKVVAAHHFDRGENTNLENEMFFRKAQICVPPPRLPNGVYLTRSIPESSLNELLVLLQTNAYWQEKLTMERLKLLVASSSCFYALSADHQIIGFSRVLTNHKSFASLWDVVVSERYRGQSVGTALMHDIFSDKQLSTIPGWILFTDSARKLYEKFGFVPISESPQRQLVHKLRLQDHQPVYMHDLMRTMSTGLCVDFSPAQAFVYLFGATGKRERLSCFWESVHPEPYSIAVRS